MLNWIIPTPSDCDSFKLSKVDNESLVYDKQFAYVGQFYKAADDIEFEITEQAIDHWVDVQDSLLSEHIEVPMPLEHINKDNPEKKRATALSYFKKTDSKGRVGLFGKVKFKNETAARDLCDSQTSIYVEREMITPVKKKHHHLPITHVAFTNYPVLPGMDKFTEIAASLNATPVFTKDFFKSKDIDMADTISLSALAKSLGIEVKEKQDDKVTSEGIVGAFSSLQKESSSLKEKTSLLEKEVESLTKQIPAKKNLPVISASILGMGTENRQHKIDDLLREGFISSAQAKNASDKYCSKPCMVLSLSSESSTDDFEWWVKNEKLGLSETLFTDENGETRPQNRGDSLTLSNSDVSDPTKNVFAAEVEKRAKAMAS